MAERISEAVRVLRNHYVRAWRIKRVEATVKARSRIRQYKWSADRVREMIKKKQI